MNFEPCFKIQNFVAIQEKSTKLDQGTYVNVVLYARVSIYQLDKILSRSSPHTTSEWPIAKRL